MGVAGSKPPNDPKKKEAAIVDGLLRQLKYADPTLKGDPEPKPSVPPVRPGVSSAPVAKRRRDPTAKHAWAWVALTAVLAGAVTQWPYANACGWGLLGYGAVLVVWVAAATWAAITAWRARCAAAHVVALVLLALALAAITAEVLPRMGYARVPASWRCGVSTMGGP